MGKNKTRVKRENNEDIIRYREFVIRDKRERE